jgi:hypothetical protein
MIISRLDEVTTTLLLGEVAAGAFGRRLAGISTEAHAKAVAEVVGRFQKKDEKGEESQPKKPAKIEGEAKVSSTVSPGGELSRADGQRAEVAGEITKIHKAFKDDMGTDTLLVACVTALGQEKVDPNDAKAARSPPTKLGALCQKFFENLEQRLMGFAKADAYSDVLTKCAGVVADNKANEEDKKVCRRVVESVIK